jgi:rhamnose utilization protein RhaD (predicted bifunctional aldolase and dehydrogenase)
MNNKMSELEKLSRYAGERFDLIQASGGNTSVKYDNGRKMAIKSSGVTLSEVTANTGYCIVKNKSIITGIATVSDQKTLKPKEREKIATTILTQAIIGGGGRPSIETFLHSLLPNYVLHTHPVLVNAITCQKSWKKIVTVLFPQALQVSYRTPGIELAIVLSEALDSYYSSEGKLPNIIFLQNHGLIISGDNVQEVIKTNEMVIQKIAKYFRVDTQEYEHCNALSELLSSVFSEHLVTYTSRDVRLHQALKKNVSLLRKKPFCPDTYVFCGREVVRLRSLQSAVPIKKYFQKYQEIPKVIEYAGQLFFVAPNIKKAKEIAEVFMFHILALSFVKGKINVLSKKEMDYLGGWDAEKYRQAL